MTFLQKSWSFVEHAKWIGTTFTWIMYVQRYSVLIWLVIVYPDWRFPWFTSVHKTNPQTVPCTCGFTIYSHFISLCVQPKIQQIMVRGFCRPLDWASTSCPLLTKSLVQVLSDYVETPKAFGELRPDQWLRGVTTISRACLLADSHKIRNVFNYTLRKITVESSGDMHGNHTEHLW